MMENLEREFVKLFMTLESKLIECSAISIHINID